METRSVSKKLFPVLGGGYVGIEFGQMFRRFGAEVTIIDMGKHIMGREDEDVATALEEILREDGIRILNQTRMIAVESSGDGTVVAQLPGSAGGGPSPK